MIVKEGFDNMEDPLFFAEKRLEEADKNNEEPEIIRYWSAYIDGLNAYKKYVIEKSTELIQEIEDQTCAVYSEEKDVKDDCLSRVGYFIDSKLLHIPDEYKY